MGETLIFPALRGVLTSALVGFVYIMLAGYPLPHQFENAMIQVVYMACGLIYRKYETELENVNKGSIALMTIGYVALAFLNRGELNVHRKLYGNFLLFLLCAIVGLYIWIRLAKWIDKKTVKYKRGQCATRSLIFIGKNTFVYYSLQGKAIWIVDKMFSILGLTLSVYLASILKTAIISVILLFASLVINKWFPFILRGSFKRPHSQRS